MNEKTAIEKYKPVSDEDESFDWRKILSFLDIIKRRKFVIIQIISLALLIGFVRTRMITPLYMASSKVIILPRTQVISKEDSYIFTPQLSRGAQLEMIQSSMTGDNIAKVLKEKHKIDLSPGAIMGCISLGTDEKKPEIILINVINTVPEYASLIANYAADNFVERNKELDSIKMKKSREIIEEQLTIVEKDLRDAEDKLVIMQKKNKIIDINTEINAKIGNLAEMENAKTTSEIEKSVAQAKLTEAEKGLGELSIDEKDPVVQDLEKQLAGYEIELAGLRQKWAEDHPDVLNTKAKIEETKKRLQNALMNQKSGEKEKNQLIVTQAIEFSGEKAKQEGLNVLIQQTSEDLKDLPEKLLDMKRLMRDLDVAENKYKTLMVKAQEAKLSEATQQGNAEVMSYASLPGAPSNPDMKKNLQMAFLIGLILGILVAIILEQLNISITGEEDITKYLKLKTIEVLPRLKFSGKNKILIKLNQTQSKKYTHLEEAFRSLRTVLNFATRDEKMKTLLVISSIPSEGKTTVATNLAISYAQMGKKVLLVEADLLRPVMHKYFDLKEKRGFADLLSDESLSLPMVTQESDIPGLKIINAGKKLKLTSELFESLRMREIMKRFKESREVDLVIFDSPPCQPVTDGIILSSMVDKVLLVISLHTNARIVQRSLKSLESAKADILGAVLNKMETGKGSSYYSYKYKYGYYYSSDEKKEQEKAKQIEEEPSPELVFVSKDK